MPPRPEKILRIRAPLHALVGNIREGMAERREFPVEHGEQARCCRMEDHVVEAIVAVDDRHAAVVFRHAVGEPGDERIHRRDRSGFRCAILIRPALELAFEIGAGRPKSPKADAGGIGGREFRQSAVHLVVDLAAILARDVGERGSQKMRPSMRCMT